MWRGEVKVPSTLKLLVLRAATENSKHSLLTFPLTWQRQMGSTENWEARLPADNYVTGKSRPVFPASRIHSTRNKSPHRALHSAHRKARVSLSRARLPPSSAVSQGREALFPGSTHLFLGGGHFQRPALTYKGRSGKRQTVPINIISNTNQLAICFVIK